MDHKLNKGNLGKGLGSLLGDSQYSVLAANSAVRVSSDTNNMIRIDSIVVNPGQPRTEFDQTELEELAQSIKTYGLIQPITVRPIENGKYQIISGERRWRASKLAGLTEILAYVRSVDEVQSIQMALVENIQRADLNAIEIAVSYRRLLDECALTQEELSTKVGKSVPSIVNYLRLLKLSKEVQIAVRDNRISMGHARAIAGFDDADIQNRMLTEILQKGLSVLHTEALAKKIAEEAKPQRKVKIKLSDDIILFKKSFSEKLKTPVTINKDVTGKGKITIPFKSNEELASLMKLLMR